MGLSSDLVSQFVKMTNDNTKKKTDKVTANGTVVKYEGEMYVKLDGSDLLTPVDTSSTLHENDRVLVDIGGHSATVSGNITNPSVSGFEIKETKDAIIVEIQKGIDVIVGDGFDIGITSINTDGISVKHSSYDGYTKMSANGFYLNDGGKDVLKCTKDGLVFSGDITSSAISSTSINIGGNFKVTTEGVLTTNTQIYAEGGIYTHQDIRGMDNTDQSGGLTLVTGTGNLAIRTENASHSVYLQSASGEVKVTAPSDPDTFTNLRAYNLLANNAVYANGLKLTSDRNRKRDIEEYKVDALNEICTTPVYAYHLDVDLDEELKRIGIIMQEAPLDAVDLGGKGIDLYQMASMMWRAIQQLNEKLDERK